MAAQITMLIIHFFFMIELQKSVGQVWRSGDTLSALIIVSSHKTVPYLCPLFFFLSFDQYADN